MEYNKYKSVYVALIFVFGLPLLSITNDFWDGAPVLYGFRINDLSGIKLTYFESGWYLQYYFYQFIHTLSNNFGINEEIILKLITLLSVIGISIEVKRLSIYLFDIPENMSYVAAYCVLLFPAWFVLVSNALFIHVLCIYLLLFGYRQVMVQRKYIFGVFPILISFQLQSNCMFIIGIIITDYIARNEKNKITNFTYVILSITVIIVLFFVIRHFSAGVGEYANYNKIQLNFSMIRPVIGATVYFSIFILVLISLPLLFFILNYTKIYEKADSIKYYLLFLLIVCATFPYIILGKSPVFFDFYDWKYRQAFVLAIPIPILIAFLYSSFQKAVHLKVALTLILFSSFLYVGFYYKYKSEFHRNAIVYNLKKISQPPNGILGLNVISNNSGYLLKIRPYEYNTLFQKAYGRANWMISNVKVNDTNDIFKLRKWQKTGLSTSASRIKNGSQFAGTNCQTLIELTQQNDMKLLDLVTKKYDGFYKFEIVKSTGIKCLVTSSG